MNKKSQKLSITNYGFNAKLLLVLALSSWLIALGLLPSRAGEAAIYSTINFQGKVVNSNGTNIADGTYNMQFKLYTGGDGVVGGADETLQWTEQRLRNNSQGVSITDGIFQVNLGSVTALPDIFNNNTIWLSMNLGNTNATCTPFSNCVPDGEMSPMIRLTAAPYALNSDKLGGLQATNFVQLAQGLQTDASATNASIAINKTGGTANILTLQKSGADIFTINNSGLATFSSDVTLALAETEDLAINIAISGTNAGQGQVITLANSSTSGTQSGLIITNADDAANAVTEALVSLSNAEGAANTVTDGLIISGTAAAGLDTIVDAIDVSDDNITNAINIGTNFLVASGDSINDFTGNGLQVTTNALTLRLTAAADALSSTASSSSGMEVLASGLTLLQGCTDAQILKWNETSDVWACNTDNSGSGTADLDTVYANDADKIMTINNAAGLTFNFTTTGLFAVKDNTNTNGLVFDTSNNRLKIYEDIASPANFLELYYDNATSSAIIAASSGTTKVGSGSGPISLTAGASAAITITGNAASTWSTSAGGLTITGGSTLALNSTGINALTIDSTTTGAINIGTNANAKTVTIGNSTGASAIDIISGTGNIDLLPGGTGDIVLTLDNDSSFITTGTVTDTGFLHDLNLTLGDDLAADTVSALNIDVTSVDTGADSDILRGIDIANLTGGNANVTEQALRIGTGWDVGLRVESGGVHVTGGGVSLNGTAAASGELLTSNLGIHFTESDTNPGCAAGDYKIYADLSETKLKRCVNGVVLDFAAPEVNNFVDATTEAWVDIDTTDLWDGTYPNITPSSSSSEILVMMSAYLNTTSATDQQFTAKIMRHTSAITCQTTGTIVWTVGTFSGFTAGQVTMDAVFVDTPATASNVQYTLCTDADSESTGATMNTIQFTLYEVNDRADLAEVYPTNDDSLSAAEVVSMDPGLEAGVMRTSRAYDPNLIGVVSTRPALTIGGRNGEGINGKPIALTGRVPVKVKGPIKKGDVLTSSNIPGVAMQAVKAGPILGVALADYNGEGTGSVLTFVKTGYFNGSNLRDVLDAPIDQSDLGKSALSYFMRDDQQLGGAVDLSEVMTDRLTAGLEIIAPKIIADQVALNNIEAATAENIQINSDVEIFGTLRVDKLIANQIEGLEVLTNRVGRLPFDSAQGKQEQNESPADNLGSNNESRMVIDSASIALDLTVDGLLEANGGLVVNGLAQFNGETVFDKLVTFSDKSLFKGDVEFEGRTTFNNDSGGFAVIKTGQQEVEIIFDKSYETSPVISLAVKNGQFIQYAYVETVEDDPRSADYNKIKGFRILLQHSAIADIEFSWTAFAIKDPKVSQNSTNP